MNLPVSHADTTLSSRCPGALLGSPLLSGENPHPQSPWSWLVHLCGFLHGPHAPHQPLSAPALLELSQHQCQDPPAPSFPELKPFAFPLNPGHLVGPSFGRSQAWYSARALNVCPARLCPPTRPDSGAAGRASVRFVGTPLLRLGTKQVHVRERLREGRASGQFQDFPTARDTLR